MRKRIFSWLFILFITISLSVSFISNKEFFYNLSCNNQTSNYTPELLIKNSGYWVLSSVYIDGDAQGFGAHNWTWVESQEWFGGGSGTKEDPYIIENITINRNGDGNCIRIRDSEVYFEIRNCTCIYGFTAGIQLINVRRGKITNVNCANNSYGINLVGSNGIIIHQNDIVDNFCHGIFLENSNSCIITENSVIHNGYNPYRDGNLYIPECHPRGGGIAFWTSYNSSITHNQINFNYHFGIALGSTIVCSYWGSTKPCCNNLISNNIINDTVARLDEGGIWIRTNSNDNKIKNNILILANIEIGHCFRINMTENKLYYSWISLGGTKSSDSSHFIDTTNKINESTIYYMVNKSGGKLNNYSGAGMLILVNCNNTEISNMIFSSHTGIFMRYCFNNTLMENQFNIWYHSGIDCVMSSSNNIRNNLFNKCGISLNHCNKNNISENHIFKGLDGIYLRSSSQNNVLENHISMADYGMFIEKCREENTISQNHISVADYGMFIWESCNATISYNNIYNTNISIYLWDSSYNYVKSNILFSNKSCILEDGVCIGNTFEENTCNETPELPTDSILGYNSLVLIFSMTLIAVILYIEKNSKFAQEKA